MTVQTPQDMSALMKKCIKVTNHWVDECNKKFELQLPYPKVEFSIKGTTAGRAHLSKNVIAYNPTLLRENCDKFLARTPGHEVVHFAAWHKYKDRGHGDAWKRMMIMMGLESSRCHTYDTSKVPTKVGKVSNHTEPKVIQTQFGTTRFFGVGKVTEFDD